MERMSARDIIRLVCDEYGLKLTDILSRRCEISISRPRQVAYWLVHELTNLTYPQIARSFRRHHTTIIYGVWRINGLMARDSYLRDRVARLMDRATQ